MSSSNPAAAATPTNDDAAAAPSATYDGSCHCGGVAYRVTVSPPLDHADSTVTSCNCSICVRKGYLLVYVPSKNVAFEEGKGRDGLKNYTFAQERFQHSFCPTCGTSLFAESITPDLFPDMMAVNVRTFHDVDVSKLKIKEIDGKSL
ncbi:hypothetical protein AOQ84DRAFT_356964 [Glonium stellatum]|uniref:CENP-V/GFA domain-containing protein n=1 Tax=Glonium stellatum TaxID=574774 RepID=A0A8E2JN43_9PEZI|nr:hypothetical protein AOQ84DRAFT_356964 [Glonium stellatum]